MIWQSVACIEWHSWHTGNTSGYLLFVRRVKQCSRHSGWCNELPDTETTNLLHFSYFQGSVWYTPVLLMSKSLLLHCKVFINALSISYSCLLAEPQQGCREIAWKIAVNFCYVGREVTFFITEVCHNSARLGTRTGAGSVYMWQYF